MCEINQAYRNASDDFIEILMILIDKENNLDRQLSIHQQAIDCWDNKLEKAFLERLSDDALTASSLGSLLQILLQNEVIGLDYCKSLSFLVTHLNLVR
jgi:hypothetical protein